MSKRDGQPSLPDDCKVWRLDAEQSRHFAEALANPPEPNAALRAAAERYKMLVRSKP